MRSREIWQLGVTWIQIREKDLSARALFELVEAALKLPNPHGSKIIVNTRADVPGCSRRWSRGRSFTLGIARSAHVARDRAGWLPDRRVVPLGGRRAQAEAEGADYAVFGPVFPPRSKTAALEPRGLEGLRRAAAAVRIPVLALGGVTRENSAACVSAGAAGVAGITLCFKSLVKSNS